MTELPTAITTGYFTGNVADLLEGVTSDAVGYVYLTPLAYWLPMPGETPGTITSVKPVKADIVGGEFVAELLAMKWEARFYIDGILHRPDPLIVEVLAGETVDAVDIVTAQGDTLQVETRTVPLASVALRTYVDEQDAQLAASIDALGDTVDDHDAELTGRLSDVSLSATIAAAVAGANVYDFEPSGDTSGATDTAAIQAALTAARLAGGGVVTGRPGTYYTNDTLEIGSDTTLHVRGCEIILVSGSDCLMLANHSSMNMVMSFLGSCSINNVNFYVVTADRPAVYESMRRGMTIDVLCTFGAATTTRFVATVTGALSDAADSQFTVSSGPPSAIPSSSTVRVWERDRNITVEGGVWDRQDNGAALGDAETNHVMRFRSMDGLVVRDVTYASTVFNNGRYAALIQAITGVLFERIQYGRDPGVNENWDLVSSGYARDGVHITGPAKKIALRDFYGAPGDDMVSITSSDYVNIAGNYAGDVEDVVIENMLADRAGQCSVKVIAGPAQVCRNITIRNIHGPSSSSAGLVTIGDDDRQATTMNGSYDKITVDGAFGNPGTNPVVSLMGDLGNITLRNINYDTANGIDSGAVEIGTAIYGGTLDPTTIDHLVIEGLDVRNASTGQGVFVASGSTVAKLTMRGTFGAVADADLIGGTGTVTTLVSAG